MQHAVHEYLGYGALGYIKLGNFIDEIMIQKVKKNNDMDVCC